MRTNSVIRNSIAGASIALFAAIVSSMSFPRAALAETAEELCPVLFRNSLDESFCREALGTGQFSPVVVSNCADLDAFAALDCLSRDAHALRVRTEASPELLRACAFEREADTDACLEQLVGKSFTLPADPERCQSNDPVRTARCLQTAAF